MSARTRRFLAALFCGWMALCGLPGTAGAASASARALAADNYQGLWWNAQESGWGINFAHQGDIIFATWFTYDAAGKPWWLIAELHKSAAGVYTGAVATVSGPPFDTQPWDLSRVAEATVGTMTATFASAKQATIAYSVNGITQTKAISKQVFGPEPTCVFGAQPNLALATNYQDLWWNPAGESGWGINLTHQGDIIFATWFTYDAAGRPWWLIAELHRTPDGTYAGDVSTVTGPAFSSVPFDSTKVKETVVGTATAIFADGNTALFTYTVNGVSQAKSITRQVFVPPGTVCAVAADPAAAFDVRALPESLLLVPGETRDVYVTIAPRNGFTGPVALAVDGLPAGVGYQIEPATPTVGSEPAGARLRFSVAPSAAATAEPALVTVRGTAGGGLSAAAVLDLGVAPSGDPIAVRLATVAAVQQRAHELKAQQLSRAAYLDAMAAFMAGRPGIAAAGVDVETSTAWGRYADGTLHFVAENRDPAPKALAASQADVPRPKAQGAALPGATKARVLQSFGPRFTEGETAVNQMRGYFQGRGWTLRGGGSGATDVGSLKGVSGDGFVYINTHGGRGEIDDPSEPESKIYSIQSSTLADQDYEKVFAADLKANRLILFTARNGDTTMAPIQAEGNEFIEVPAVDTRYGITYRFVDAYMSFASESVVWIDACFSSRNTAFTNAFLRKGAGVYLGWSDYLSVDASTASAPYFVDRMLGANQHPTRESPPQRAFSYDLVLQDMAKRGLDFDRNHNGRLQATAKSGLPYPPIFAPSIRYAQVDEYLDTLTLVGEFGPQQGKVSVGGTEIAVKSWSASTIVATLPRSGAGSVGDVVVEVRGAKSNARQLTAWSLPLRYTWFSAYDVPGLQFDGSGTVRYRADVGGYRTTPGEAPKYRLRGGAPTKDSSLTVTASGSHTDGDCTQTLSGTGNFVSPAALGGVPGTVLASAFSLAGETKLGALGLGFGAIAIPFQMTYTGKGCSGTYPTAPTMGLLDGPTDFPAEQTDNPQTLPLPGIHFVLNSQFGIPATSRLEAGMGGTITVSWTAAPAQSPPRDAADAGK